MVIRKKNGEFGEFIIGLINRQNRNSKNTFFLIIEKLKLYLFDTKYVNNIMYFQ